MKRCGASSRLIAVVVVLVPGLVGAIAWVACDGDDRHEADFVVAPGPDVDSAALDGETGRGDVLPDVVSPPDTAMDSPDSHGVLPGGASSYPWLFDSNVWLPVTGIEDCAVYEANTQKLAWPGHEWTSCGTGCRVAPSLSGPAEAWLFPNTTRARWLDGRLIVSATIHVGLEPPVILLARYELDSGIPISLLRVHFDDDKPCLAGFALNGDRVFGVYPFGSEHARIGLAPMLPGDSVTWALPPMSKLFQSGFDYDTGWGGEFDNTTIRISHDWTSTEMAPVHSGAYIGDARGFRNGVFWNDWEAPRASLWNWTNTRGTAVRFVQGPWDIADFALSDTHVVWLGVQGEYASSGSYESARLYWTPFTTESGEVQLHEGPALSVSFNSGTMQTAGDWAVIPSYHDHKNRAMLVVRFSDQRVWSIPGRTGDYSELPLAISESELLVEESTLGTELGGFLRLLRYDLSLLDTYATVVQ